MLHDFAQSKREDRGLDTAAVEPNQEYARAEERATSRRDLEHRRRIAHDLRNLVHTALLSFKVLEARNALAGGGSAGAVLGRSLAAIRDLADTIASEARPSSSACAAAASSRAPDARRTESVPPP